MLTEQEIQMKLFYPKALKFEQAKVPLTSPKQWNVLSEVTASYKQLPYGMTWVLLSRRAVLEARCLQSLKRIEMTTWLTSAIRRKGSLWPKTMV